MLTKQEREEIAKRCNQGIYPNEYGIYASIYERLIGETVPCDTSAAEDFITILNRIKDLCDTSSMISLPLDRDGEIIRIGDIVYDENHIKYRVDGYVMRSACKSIVRLINSRSVLTNRLASNLHHKETATAKSLAKQIKDILNDEGEVTLSDLLKLGDIAEQLETLGDGNE